MHSGVLVCLEHNSGSRKAWEQAEKELGGGIKSFSLSRQCGSLNASSRQPVEQRLGLFQVERVKAFCEPALDRSEKIAGLIPLALIAKKSRHAHRGAQFPGLRLLRPRNREHAVEIRVRFLCDPAWATSARFPRTARWGLSSRQGYKGRTHLVSPAMAAAAAVAGHFVDVREWS